MSTATRHLLFLMAFILTSLVVDEVITLKQGHAYYMDAKEEVHVDIVPLKQHFRSRRQVTVEPSKSSSASSPSTTPPTTSSTTTLASTSVAQTPALSTVNAMSPNKNLDDGSQNFIDSNEVRDSDVILPTNEIRKRINETFSQSKDLDQMDTDTHKYYRAKFIQDNELWVNLDLLDQSIVKEHKMLSTSYRRAATIPLTFNFPFYGHNVSNITIATGGFLYTGDYVHAWLAATQYIAPLMANFDTSQNDNAKIRYADNGTALIVEWEKVHLKAIDGSALSTKASPFSFQVILHKNGDIVFVYKIIPVAINLIGDKDHPVKVGISDAYIIDRTIFFVRRKTIYEYHRMDLKNFQITSSTAIYFNALKTCNGQSDCQSCIDTEVETTDGTGLKKDLGCMWCPSLQRCSDGMDRLRQEWLMNSCDTFHHKKGDKECHVKIDVAQKDGKKSPIVSDHTDDYHRHMGYSTLMDGVEKEKIKSMSGHYQAGIVTISVGVLLVLSLTVWFVYAYFFPHTWSGQLLIKYRPSHWQWRRAEPRYTAASIHM